MNVNVDAMVVGFDGDDRGADWFVVGPQSESESSANGRGGSASSILCMLSQLHAEKCWLVASLGGAQEARVVTRELEADGVSTRYCKVWEGAGVPAAWVLHAGEYPYAFRPVSTLETC